jgi:hypothetical protein
MQFPSQTGSMQDDFRHLLLPQHNQDVTAVVAQPLPPLFHRLPLAVYLNTTHPYLAVRCERAIYSNFFHKTPNSCKLSAFSFQPSAVNLYPANYFNLLSSFFPARRLIGQG